MSHTRKELCGCKIGLFPEPVECTVCHQINPVDHYTLEYCPLHASAPELLEALQLIISILPDGNSPSHLKAKQAVAHAEGKA